MEVKIPMNPNDRVRMVHDPTRIGVLTEKVRSSNGRQLRLVRFMEGSSWVPESQLVLVGNRNQTPLEMLQGWALGTAVNLRRTLTHAKLSGNLSDVIYSMEATRTDFYAYQFKPVLRMLESPANGILIADEVGLGKTIEAGLIWTELKSRYDLHRLVVLCPAALKEKWQGELTNRFGVTSSFCSAEEMLKALKNGEAVGRGTALIGSLQGLRPGRDWEKPGASRASSLLARYLDNREHEEPLIDLLVIDEAHHLRNAATRTHKLGELFQRVSKHTVLLSATPVHNRNQDLFSLLKLLDPDTFSHPDAFNRILQANAPLLKARDLLLNPKSDLSQFGPLLEEARRHPLLTGNQQLELIKQTDLDPRNLGKLETRNRLAARLETVNLLAHAVTRTRKRDVVQGRVPREPKLLTCRMSGPERKFYDLVTRLVIDYAQKREANERFLLSQPQRQMTSSMAAALRAWQGRLIELEEAEESGIRPKDEKRRKALGPLVTEIVRSSRTLVGLDELERCDTKYDVLRATLQQHLKDFPREKLVLFSSFRATLNYLAERLQKNGVSCIQLMGGMVETKQEIITRFQEPTGPSVLLSSEVGGEGVDLQFSSVVINYDLPWNPMRLEQRIGRVDRLGQTADKVRILNLLHEDTIDSRIYTRLYEKLNLCVNALGDFEAILGNKIRKLTEFLLSREMTPAEQDWKIQQTASALEETRRLEEVLEEEAAGLIAYGDYILNQVTTAHELHRWISGEDIKRYVLDYLRVHYPGCGIQQISKDPIVFELELSNQAKVDLREFLRITGSGADTTLLDESRHQLSYLFDNRVVHSGRGRRELINRFHPLVRLIQQKLRDSNETLTPAVSLVLPAAFAPRDIGPGDYLLAVDKFTATGLQKHEQLSYTACRIETNPCLLSGTLAEGLAAAAINHGEDWLDAPYEVDREQVLGTIDDVLLPQMEESFQEFEREKQARNTDRFEIQSRTLQHHLERRTKQLEEIMERHEHYKRDSLAKATQGSIDKLTSRTEQRLLEIEKHRFLGTEYKEVALAIVRVI